MKTKQAIQLLTLQKNKLPNENVRTHTWLTQTTSIIKDAFGKDSEEYIHINDFEFYSITMDSMSATYNTNAVINTRKVAVATFIDNCIETIEVKGVHKEKGGNFLNNLSDTALWTIIGTIIPLLCATSYYLGKREGDNRIEKVEIQNQKLRDSIKEVAKNFPLLEKDKNKKP